MPIDAPTQPIRIELLTPARRALAAALRVCAAFALAWLAWRMAWYDGWQVQSLLQLQIFGAGVVLPLVAAWLLRRASRASAHIEAGTLQLQARSLRVEIPLASIATLRPWALPLPGTGLDLELRSGRRFAYGIGVRDPIVLQRALAQAGAVASGLLPHATLAHPCAADARWADPASERRARDARARVHATWPRLDHALVKFGAFPLLLALPAFRLHQHIAFGGTFGEAYTFGPGAWLTGLLIWWAAWATGLMLFAALLRVIVEVGAQFALRVAPGGDAVRTYFTAAARAIYYLGVPAWLIGRLLVG